MSGLVPLVIKRQSGHYIETSQLICSANQLTGFSMMAALAFNELIKFRAPSNRKYIKIMIQYYRGKSVLDCRLV